MANNGLHACLRHLRRREALAVQQEFPPLNTQSQTNAPVSESIVKGTGRSGRKNLPSEDRASLVPPPLRRDRSRSPHNTNQMDIDVPKQRESVAVDTGCKISIDEAQNKDVLQSYATDEEFCNEQVEANALLNYAEFHGKAVDQVSIREVSSSSAGMYGWAAAEIYESYVYRPVTLLASQGDDGQVKVICHNMSGAELGVIAMAPQETIMDLRETIQNNLGIPMGLLSLVLPDGTLLTDAFLDVEVANLASA